MRSETQAVPLAKAIPGARLVLLPGIGHMLHFVAAERLTDEIARFAGERREAAPLVRD